MISNALLAPPSSSSPPSFLPLLFLPFGNVTLSDVGVVVPCEQLTLYIEFAKIQLPKQTYSMVRVHLLLLVCSLTPDELTNQLICWQDGNGKLLLVKALKPNPQITLKLVSFTCDPTYPPPSELLFSVQVVDGATLDAGLEAIQHLGPAIIQLPSSVSLTADSISTAVLEYPTNITGGASQAQVGWGVFFFAGLGTVPLYYGLTVDGNIITGKLKIY